MRHAGYFYYSIKQNWASSSQQFPLCVIKVCSSQHVLSLQTLFPDPRMKQDYRSKYCWQLTWPVSILCSGFVLSFHNHVFDYDFAVYQVVLCWRNFLPLYQAAFILNSHEVWGFVFLKHSLLPIYHPNNFWSTTWIHWFQIAFCFLCPLTLLLLITTESCGVQAL